MVDETTNGQPKKVATKKDEIPPAAPASAFSKLAAIMALPFNVTGTFPTGLVVATFFFAPFIGNSLLRQLLTPHLSWMQGGTLRVVMLCTGSLCAGGGLLLLIATIKKFWKRGVALNPHVTEAFLTDGIYAYIRDPMILGVELLLIGESILSGSFVVLAGMLFIFLPIMHLGILPRDHKRNQRTFAARFAETGDQQWNPERYLQYCKAVRRFLPRISFKGGKLRLVKYVDQFAPKPVSAKAA